MGRELVPKRVLSFDVETVPVFFRGDHEPTNCIVVASFSFLGEDEIYTFHQDPWGVREYSETCRKMATEIRQHLTWPDIILTGHYIQWADLPWVNGLMYRTGLPMLPPVMTHDTGKLKQAKGFKKGLAEMISRFGVDHPKVQMMEDDWRHLDLVKKRCEEDVRAHKEVYKKLRDLEYLKAPKVWKG